MKFWVIGAQGMLGSVLVETCRRNGIDVVGSSRQEADVTQLKELLDKATAIQPTHIVNCAAFTDVDGAEKHPELAYAVNTQGAENAAIVAKQCGARLIHISTDYVFNGNSLQPYGEEHLCEPLNTYGKSKREGEHRIAHILPEACIVRTSWLFGAQGKNFISSLVHWLNQKEELQVVTDQCGRPTYCYDLAEAILKLANAQGIVHFANAGPQSRYHIALAIQEMLVTRGQKLKCQKITPVLSQQFPTLAKRPSYSVLDTDYYSQLTNHQPRSWEEAMQEYLDNVSI